MQKKILFSQWLLSKGAFSAARLAGKGTLAKVWAKAHSGWRLEFLTLIGGASLEALNTACASAQAAYDAAKNHETLAALVQVRANFLDTYSPTIEGVR